jgi:hypothetical protein
MGWSMGGRVWEEDRRKKEGAVGSGVISKGESISDPYALCSVMSPFSNIG